MTGSLLKLLNERFRLQDFTNLVNLIQYQQYQSILNRIFLREI